jgi:hypothetical protein
MFWMSSVILFVIWLLAVSNSFTFDGYIHVLLGINVLIVTIQLIRNQHDIRLWKQKYKGAFQVQR